MNFGGLTTAAIGDRLTLVLMLVVVFGSGIILLEAIIYTVLAKVIKTRHALAFTLLAPAVIALALFTVYPLFYNFQLAFSDLRLKTLPCYTANGASTAQCPMERPEAGKTARISLDALTIYADAGESAKSLGTVKRDAIVSVLQSGPSTSAAVPQSGSAGTGSGGGFDLSGGTGGSSATSGATATAASTTSSGTGGGFDLSGGTGGSGDTSAGAMAATTSAGATATAVSTTSSGTGGGFDLSGGTGGSSDTSGVGATATVAAPAIDSRTWWQIKTRDGITGWIPEFLTASPDSPSLKQDPTLYSLEYGLKNFRDVFFDVDSKTGQITGWGRLIRTEGSTFPVLLARTVLWTLLNVFFHLVIGFSLALLLNSKLRGKSIYRMIILIPWAIPQVIAALTWRSEFQSQYGFVNAMLKQFGIAPVPWLTQPIPAFVAVVFVNIWLGVPFYMVVLLGGLGSISREYYEAAEMDGSSIIQRFWAITVPLIRPIAVPIITLDAIWTFNMFNVIYLITGGEPNESTNILVTALYNAAFGPNGTYRLGFAAAFSILNFLLLLVLATFWVRSSGALKRVDE